MQSRKRFWRLPLTRVNLLSHIGDSRMYFRIGQGVDDGIIESADNVVRRLFGRLVLPCCTTPHSNNDCGKVRPYG
jgi:hypothetical protein